MILVKNGRLVPELIEGFTGNAADILIDDNHCIAKIKAPGEIAAEDARVIDAAGRTVLPGFFDLHSHLYFTDYDFEKLAAKSIPDTTLDMYSFAREYLKQGYVVLRDAGSPHNITLNLKKAREQGHINIPEIISCGMAFTPSGPGNQDFRTIEIEIDDPADYTRCAEERLAQGHEILKYMVTGSFMNEGGEPGATIMTKDQLEAAVKVAREHDTYCFGHAHGAEGIRMAIEAGFYTVEHISFIDDEAIEMFRNADNCFPVPTGGVGLICRTDPSEAIQSDYARKIVEYEKLERECVTHAYKMGLKMGFGSDLDYTSFTRQPGLEFLARTDWYDFDYKDILLQATKYSAEIAKMDDRKGTIRVGKDGDLVIVNGNPDEDIHVMASMPDYVISNGEIIMN